MPRETHIDIHRAIPEDINLEELEVTVKHSTVCFSVGSDCRWVPQIKMSLAGFGILRKEKWGNSWRLWIFMWGPLLIFYAAVTANFYASEPWYLRLTTSMLSSNKSKWLTTSDQETFWSRRPRFTPPSACTTGPFLTPSRNTTVIEWEYRRSNSQLHLGHGESRPFLRVILSDGWLSFFGILQDRRK